MLRIDIAITKSILLSEIDRIKASIELQTLSNAYSAFFKNVKLPNTSLVRIHFTDNPDMEENLIKPHKVTGNICFLETYYNIQENYYSKANTEKQNAVLHIIHEYLFKLSPIIGLDTDTLTCLINKIKSDKTPFRYIIFNSKQNQSKTLSAELTMELNPTQKVYYLNITDLKNNITTKHEFLRLNNYYLSLYDQPYNQHNNLLSKMRWDDNSIKLIGTKGPYERIIHSYDVLNNSVSVEFNLEPDVDDFWFKKEYHTATTTDEEQIDEYLKDQLNPNWHIYL